jgi:poly-gamma-glutamate capsule biosynthesis protein CapA/YwtB (metallophosphatase superfamily)
LKDHGISSAGAGRNATEAQTAAVIRTPTGKGMLVWAVGCASSGSPLDWAANGDTPSVNLLHDFSARTVAVIAKQARAVRQPDDLLTASIHWGGNWGYQIARDEARFTHALVDKAGFDVVHGQSTYQRPSRSIGQADLLRLGEMCR